MTTALAQRPQFDQEAILRSMGIDVSTIQGQALLVICERYGLDPIMKHVVLISGKPYVTRDGLLHVAHRSSQLDGIELLDEGETPTHWWAKVAVYRKDMSHPFTFRGRYPKSGTQKTFGPEMALKCSEMLALRRAFDVTGLAVAEEMWDTAEVAVKDADRSERIRVAEAVKALDEDVKLELRAWCTTHDVPLVVGKQSPEQFASFVEAMENIVPLEGELEPSPAELDPDGEELAAQQAALGDLADEHLFDEGTA